jgi:hypothetical protein
MADENRSRSLVEEQPETIVRIPEAPEHTPERISQEPTVVEERAVPWFQRREAPWIVGAVLIGLIGLLLVLLQSPTTQVSAVPEPGPATTAIDPDAPPWTALSLPVPESLRTHTVNVSGSVDTIAVAAPSPGAAQLFVGSVTTADGPTVQQLFGDHAFSLTSSTSPTGTPIIAFIPYQAGDALIVDPGQEVTFVGTLMPVPEDFSAMVGADAAWIAIRTGVYVRVVPETLRIVTPVPDSL